jgi:hypothetical protein
MFGRPPPKQPAADLTVPLPTDDVTTILNRFADAGFSPQEMVALLSSHTIAAADKIDTVCLSRIICLYPHNISEDSWNTIRLVSPSKIIDLVLNSSRFTGRLELLIHRYFWRFCSRAPPSPARGESTCIHSMPFLNIGQECLSCRRGLVPHSWGDASSVRCGNCQGLENCMSLAKYDRYVNPSFTPNICTPTIQHLDNQEKMVKEFAAAMAKLQVLGQDSSKLIDCSDVRLFWLITTTKTDRLCTYQGRTCSKAFHRPYQIPAHFYQE